MRLDMKFNAIEPLKCMSHYNIVMDEYRHKKKSRAGRRNENYAEMKNLLVASWDCEAVLSRVRYMHRD